VIGHWLAEPRTRGVEIDDPRYQSVRREVVREKAFLRRIYEEWYAAIAEALPSDAGRVLELGSGGGFFDERLAGLITSDVQWSPHVRVVLDAECLPFGSASLRAIVMTDVLHHVPAARRFVREAGRCVRPGGRIVMIEPWVSAWSTFAYSRFHHEPFEPGATEWDFPRGGPLSAANMALPWIMFVRDRDRFERECPEFRILSIRPFMPLRYLLSGGVSVRSLVPAWTFGLWRAIEHGLDPWRDRLGMFAHIVLERIDAEIEP
jgi:SAM-dependent methyltransferase